MNPTGGPGMATGGSGDVLAGVIASLLGQFPDRDPAETIAAAVYLHGLAGDLAVEKRGEQGTIATDILECLPSAFLSVRS